MSKEKSKLEKEYDEINNPNKTLEEIEKVSISVSISPFRTIKWKKETTKLSLLSTRPKN